VGIHGLPLLFGEFRFADPGVKLSEFRRAPTTDGATLRQGRSALGGGAGARLRSRGVNRCGSSREGRSGAPRRAFHKCGPPRPFGAAPSRFGSSGPPRPLRPLAMSSLRAFRRLPRVPQVATSRRSRTKRSYLPNLEVSRHQQHRNSRSHAAGKRHGRLWSDAMRKGQTMDCVGEIRLFSGSGMPGGGSPKENSTKVRQEQ
jgi:hypothetical protein